MEIKYNIHDESFRFRISISDRCYDHKPTSEEYKSMTFHVEELNADDLLDRITSGYSICHVFRDNRRIKKNFMYTNAIFIDVDDHPQSMEDFLEGCELKPSIAYTTFSDGKNGLNRFRLIYLLDEQIATTEEYKCLYDVIVGKICLDNNKDNCGSISSQLMNGNSNDNIRVFCSNIIYYTTSFLQKCQLEIDTSSSQQYYSNRQFCKNRAEYDCTNEDMLQIVQDLNNGVLGFI